VAVVRAPASRPAAQQKVVVGVAVLVAHPAAGQENVVEVCHLVSAEGRRALRAARQQEVVEVWALVAAEGRRALRAARQQEVVEVWTLVAAEGRPALRAVAPQQEAAAATGPASGAEAALEQSLPGARQEDAKRLWEEETDQILEAAVMNRNSEREAPHGNRSNVPRWLAPRVPCPESPTDSSLSVQVRGQSSLRPSLVPSVWAPSGRFTGPLR
jgi:hypothetical protein